MVVMATLPAAAIVIENDLVAIFDAASATVTATLVNEPAVVGVPDNTPVLGAMVSPGGWPVTCHVYGGVPPEAMIWSLYVVLTVPPGSGDAVVITSAAGAMVTLNVWEFVSGVGAVASVTCTVKVKAPAVVGVPEKSPLELSVRPPAMVVGDDVIAHEYGVVPPMAANCTPLVL